MSCKLTVCVMWLFPTVQWVGLKCVNVVFPGRAHLPYYTFLHRGSYMSARDLLNLLNELGKEIKCEACEANYLFFASLINSIIQKHQC